MDKNEQFSRIDRMSKMLLKRQELINRLEDVLEELDKDYSCFKELDAYFSSEERMKDVEDDENGEIPNTINRAALSQDELYNLLEDNHDVAVHMVESAIKILR